MHSISPPIHSRCSFISQGLPPSTLPVCLSFCRDWSVCGIVWSASVKNHLFSTYYHVTHISTPPPTPKQLPHQNFSRNHRPKWRLSTNKIYDDMKSLPSWSTRMGENLQFWNTEDWPWSAMQPKGLFKEADSPRDQAARKPSVAISTFCPIRSVTPQA